MSNRARILVVDDDPLFRSLIVALLRKDCLVSVASEGSEGFYKALEHPPDVAIVDVQMPGWDGLKTLKAFRSHPALSEVKVVMLTSDASKETVLAAIHGGANDYVIKTSFSKGEFYQKLEKLLPGRFVRETKTPEEGSPNSPAERKPQSSRDAVTAPVPQTAASATDADSRFAAGEGGPQLQELIDAWE
jgi:CheY-like chemotaxis protein